MICSRQLFNIVTFQVCTPGLPALGPDESDLRLLLLDHFRGISNNRSFYGVPIDFVKKHLKTLPVLGGLAKLGMDCQPLADQACGEIPIAMT